MLKNKENIEYLFFETIIFTLVLFSGLFIFIHSGKNNIEFNRQPVSISISVNANGAVTCQYLRVQIYQKTWILNRDNFNILAFNRNLLYENIKINIKVLHLKTIRQNSDKIPQFILRYHLFPSETDEPPVLS